MSKAPVCIIAATVVLATLPAPASAAPVGQVIRACDNMHAAGKTCNYGISGNSLIGCTEDIVFDCPADGSRQCTGSKNTTGKCNEGGTTARRVSPFRGDALLKQLEGLESSPR
jgi:hypothetical protein